LELGKKQPTGKKKKKWEKKGRGKKRPNGTYEVFVKNKRREKQRREIDKTSVALPSIEGGSSCGGVGHFKEGGRHAVFRQNGIYCWGGGGEKNNGKGDVVPGRAILRAKKQREGPLSKKTVGRGKKLDIQEKNVGCKAGPGLAKKRGKRKLRDSNQKGKGWRGPWLKKKRETDEISIQKGKELLMGKRQNGPSKQKTKGLHRALEHRKEERNPKTYGKKYANHAEGCPWGGDCKNAKKKPNSKRRGGLH